MYIHKRAGLNKINPTRTKKGDILEYSAIPPHTPVNTISFDDFFNLFLFKMNLLKWSILTALYYLLIRTTPAITVNMSNTIVNWIGISLKFASLTAANK